MLRIFNVFIWNFHNGIYKVYRTRPCVICRSIFYISMCIDSMWPLSAKTHNLPYQKSTRPKFSTKLTRTCWGRALEIKMYKSIIQMQLNGSIVSWVCIIFSNINDPFKFSVFTYCASKQLWLKYMHYRGIKKIVWV